MSKDIHTKTGVCGFSIRSIFMLNLLGVNSCTFYASLILVKNVIPIDKLPWSLLSKRLTTPWAPIIFKSFFEIILFEVLIWLFIYFSLKMSCSMKVEILPVLCNSSVSSLWDSSQLHVAYNKFNVEAFHFKVLNHLKKSCISCLNIFLKVIYPLDGHKHRKFLFTAVAWDYVMVS